MSVEPPRTPAPREASRRDTALRIALPIVVLALGVVAWDLAVRLTNTPAFAILSKKLCTATSVMAPTPSLNESPESTMPYSFSLATE